MLQTATILPHVGYPPNQMPPPVLAGMHPLNAGNAYGKIISRSPTSHALLTQAQERNLSPNKLNATKKPVFNKSQSPHGNFTNRNHGSNSPNIKYNSSGNNLAANNLANYHSNPSNPHNNFNLNINNKNPPLINSNGYQNRGVPLISPNSYDRSKYCQNHPNKLSDYTIQIDEGEYGYCQKCAINLASKGISVTKKQDRNIQRTNRNEYEVSIFEKHKIQPFYGNQYAGAYGYSEVSKFMTSIESIHSTYLHQIHKYQTIQQHYEKQYLMTQQFYENLLTTVQQMREDHLADLESEAKKHTQIAYIKEDHLKSDLNQLEIMREDLITQMKHILQNFDNSQIQYGLNQYRHQALLLKSKIQEENSQFEAEIINQNEIELQKRLKLIQEYMLNIWNEKGQVESKRKQINKTIQNAMRNNNIKPYQQNAPFYDKSPKTVKNILNIGGQKMLGIQVGNKVQASRPTACRKLFEDDSENLLNEGNQNGGVPANQYQFKEYQQGEENNKEIASPQFKNI